mmetsp:Transcript_68662/g.147108  ORF Transcript_68662/g.147108 Transcript_68662/m.147108 type:complete len:209 (-) Transcript_68662:60-686(-)
MRQLLMSDLFVEVVKLRRFHAQAMLKVNSRDLIQHGHNVLSDAAGEETALAHRLVSLDGGMLSELLFLCTLRPEHVHNKGPQLEAEALVGIVVVWRMPTHPGSGLAVWHHIDHVLVRRGLLCTHTCALHGGLDQLASHFIEDLGLVHSEEFLGGVLARIEPENASPPGVDPRKLRDVVDLAIDDDPRVAVAGVGSYFLHGDLHLHRHG